VFNVVEVGWGNLTSLRVRHERRDRSRVAYPSAEDGVLG
jgi:hypothetical protein